MTRVLAGAAALLLTSGCSLLFTSLPAPTETPQRLAAFPTSDLDLERPVRVYWDAHQIPFVEAETDRDLAYGLGLVHAHLRLGQMEILRRLAQGRLSEILGSSVTGVDHALRVVDIAQPIPKVVQQLPDDTRQWLEAFTAGLNAYIARMEVPPHEFEVFGLEPEPWTLQDVLTTSRVATADLNWLAFTRLLALRRHPEWPQLWPRLLRAGGTSSPSFGGPGRDARAAFELLTATGRNGSNAFVVSPERTASGGALIAGDPHLGFQLPNFWVLCGMKSPSYHAVGLMIPGLPAVAIGRNAHAAWGGTNMHAASTDLVQVLDLEAWDVRTRTETLNARWWLDEEVTVRDTALGPVLSDVDMIPWDDDGHLVLRWVGHQVSDEVTALLRMNRAHDFESFRAAFSTFAVSGQNYLYADAAGNIGQLMAVRLPVRTATVPEDLVVPSSAAWAGFRGPLELPAVQNPSRGYLVSANNRPAPADIPIGYFFSSDDRVDRLTELVATSTAIDLERVRAIQSDVFLRSATVEREAIRAAVTRSQLRPRLNDAEAEILDRLLAFDGHYTVESRGAVAHEVVMGYLLRRFYQDRFSPELLQIFTSLEAARILLLEDLAAADPDDVQDVLKIALWDAVTPAAPGRTWGDIHRLGLAHPLDALPLTGDKYQVLEVGVPGSRQTVLKSSHGPVEGVHGTTFGAQARHVSDLSDPDLNWFVLLGGQDGWLNSSTFADQAKLFLKGEYVQVPLRMATVRSRFERRMTLEPR